MILKQSCLKDTLHHLQNGKLQICFRYEALHFSILIYLLDSWNLSSKTSGKTLEFPEHQSSREPFKATELCSADRFPPFCGYCIFLDGLPLWLSGKELACRCDRHGFHPWFGKFPWRRKWQPTPVLLPSEFHGQRSLWATVHGVAKNQTRFSD